MKKTIVISIFLILSFITKCLFAYTTDDKKSNSFYLELNKSGVNKIYFAESITLENGVIKEAVSVTNNRHILPLFSSSKPTTISDQLYFVWELDDSAGGKINLKFVSSDTDFNTGYMLENVNNPYSSGVTKNNDFNYYVKVNHPDGSSKEINVTHDTVLSSMDISQRTIEVFDAASDSETNPGVSKLSTSYVLIEMKVLAPQWSDGTTAFMDAQYAGYIVAELKFT